MASALHQAIRDALSSPSYVERGILVTTLLEASSPLHVNEAILYHAVRTIFRALPHRLVPGTTLEIATSDLPDGGIEIFWEGKERPPSDDERRDLRSVLGRGPHGDLLEIAIAALEDYCHVNAGYVDTRREAIVSASSFDRPAYVIRRVLAVIPGESGGAHPVKTHVQEERPAAPPPRAERRPGTRTGRDASRRLRRRPILLCGTPVAPL